jgi:hypothetical protein
MIFSPSAEPGEIPYNAASILLGPGAASDDMTRPVPAGPRA